MVCVGIADASEDVLNKYAAGRYSKEGGAKEYIIGNPDLVLVQKDGVTPSAYLKKIVAALIQSIVQSVTQADAEDSFEDSDTDGVTDLDLGLDLSSSTDDADFDEERFWEDE